MREISPPSFWQRHRFGVLITVATLSLTACASSTAPTSPSTQSPTAIPEAQGFVLPTPQARDIATVCDIDDRVARSQCLIDAYLPILNAVFEPVVTSRGREFRPPTVVTDDAGALTECGMLTSPAYCPRDATLVIPLATVTDLGNRAPDAALERVLFYPAVREYFTRELTPEELSTGGAYSAVITTAHEYAHHVQSLIGSISIYRNQPGVDPASVSRRIELEADCMTGWISGYLNKTGVHVPALIDDWAAATTLTEIGDDFIDPSIGDGGHGTIEQRVAAWQEGLIAGIMLEEPYAACMAITDRVMKSAQPAPLE